MTITRRRALQALTAATAAAALPVLPAHATDAQVIDARVNLALEQLWKESPGAQDLAARAKGILVMPRVVKGGLIIGGAYGEGALRLNEPGIGYGASAAYYSMSAASVGLQAGIQKTSHALMFLTDDALAKFRRADGWEVGADAEVTFPDAGLNAGVDSTSYEKPVVGFVFGEDGLLIGASLAGAKYSLINR